MSGEIFFLGSKRTKNQVYKLLNLRIAEYQALLFLMANSGI